MRLGPQMKLNLNSTQRCALAWATARGGKMRFYGRTSWKPGTDPAEPRIINQNTVVSLLRRGLVRETGWRGSIATEVEVVPEGEVVAPGKVSLVPKPDLPGIFIKRS